MDVLLLHLAPTRSSYVSHFQRMEPLMHLYLGRALSGRHRLRLVDLRLEKSLTRALSGFRPRAAVVAVYPLSLLGLDPVLRELRGLVPEVRILVVPAVEYGASHVGERPEEYLHPLAEAVVTNELISASQRAVPAVLEAWEEGARGGDLTSIPHLLVRKEDGSLVRTGSEPVTAGDIGLPDRSLLGPYRGRYRFFGISGMANVVYTWGCRYKCEFCPMSKHDGSIVRRDPAHVMEELSGLSEPNVFLTDFEPFLLPFAMHELAGKIEEAGIRKRWFALLRADTALREIELVRRWRRLGLRWVYLGLDGHSDERLRGFHKSCTMDTNIAAVEAMKKLGLAVTVAFLVSPSFTHEDFAELRKSVARVRPTFLDFTVETPLPGTRLFDRTEETMTTRDWSLLDLQHAMLPTHLPLREFYRQMTRLHLLGARRSLPGMLRAYPLRDLARNLFLGGSAMLKSSTSLRDHGQEAAPGGIPGRDQRPSGSLSAT